MKNVQNYKNKSTNWKILTKPIDTYEISLNDTQHEYLVCVIDELNNNITAISAYGIADRNRVTKELYKEYKRINSVKHEEDYVDNNN
jgi:hypothetical protein